MRFFLVASLLILSMAVPSLAEEKKNTEISKVSVNCETATKTIRILEDEGGFQYSVWKKGAGLSEKPELSLKGEQIFDGSGGNSRFVFKNETYTYELDFPVLCEDPVCKKTLAVLKDDKELSRQVCE